jgi:hypothetical protein
MWLDFSLAHGNGIDANCSQYKCEDYGSRPEMGKISVSRGL